MDLAKIKTLIEFVGRSNITELTVTEKEMSVRIFRGSGQVAGSAASSETAGLEAKVSPGASTAQIAAPGLLVTAPVFGVLHVSPAPGEPPFVAVGDTVEEGQTLFIIEAMKIFNKVTAPKAGRIVRLTEVNGAEVEAGEILVEIA
jgi:acetyl-CoA carboxylase biotin carboxyl carrier protein